MADCDSHVPHPPSVNPSRAILIFCSTCAKTRPSCQLLLLPSATPRHPCCDLQKCKTEQNLRLAEGRKKGGCAASQNRWEEPLYRIARGRGGETPFNADRPRQPVGRSVGRPERRNLLKFIARKIGEKEFTFWECARPPVRR